MSSPRFFYKRVLSRCAFGGVALLFVGSLPAAQLQGTSSSALPYVNLDPGFSASTIYSVLTVGDSVNNKADGTPYRMVGLPDGLGAYDNNNGTFTVLMNHELGSTAGIARAHGDNGAFISQWVINKSDLRVVSGQDLIQQVALWNGSGYSAPVQSSTFDFNRFCSADLAAPTAYYNPATGLGTQARIFMNGEEAGEEGRAFAHVATGAAAGTSYQLPALGRLSWENAVANPFAGNKTIVIGTDDSTPGQVYLYEGTKTDTGNDVEKAGLTNGSLYGIKINGVTAENRATGIDGVADNCDIAAVVFQSIGNVTSLTGAQLTTLSDANGVTNFLRPEDGAWNPLNPNEFFFVTTDQFSTLKAGSGSTDGRSRLWRLTLADLNDLSTGGKLEMLLEGGTGPLGNAGQMFDNITVDGSGSIIIQEDPGNNAYLAKLWQYNPATGRLIELAAHNPSYFLSGGSSFLTQDEESSGIIDITDIMGGSSGGDRWYLFDTQAHAALGGELVEGGQLMAMHYVPVPEPATYGLIGAAALTGLVAVRRLRRKKI